MAYGAASEANVERAAYLHVRQYFARLRKKRGAFRYCAIPEYGEAHGRLHYHLLLHETAACPITWALLDAQWRSYIYADLVKDSRRTAGYVCKYLTKHLSKPRASQKYGVPP